MRRCDGGVPPRRRSNWPAELHRATGRYEVAVSRVTRARFPDEFNAVLEASKRLCGVLMLALGRRRRPERYRK